jgi:mono/diheme cytochrome c family protein
MNAAMRWSCKFGYSAGLLLVVSMTGCGTSQPDFQPNRVFLKMQQDVTRVELSPAQRQDIADILEFWFGTPDEPRLPELDDVPMAEVLDLDRLRAAAGPVGSEEDGTNFGLYRRHCSLCHGITGNGVGPAGAFLNPYARDFRRGLFKYKSTAGPMTPPTDEDLRSLLVRGMPGTSMPSFHLLADEDLDALVHYVKYLAIRGAVERALIVESVDMLNGPDDRLAMVAFDRDPPEQIREALAELTPLVSHVARQWLDAPSQTTPVPPKPADWNSPEAIRRGQQLYLGDVASCSKCHGDDGRGVVETVDYDDWTKEHVDPQNAAAVRAYMAVGALKPRRIVPRNLQWGIFRGGDRPEDIYQRIYHGIPGTPMPAAPMQAEGARAGDLRLSPDDLWDLAAYVLSLSGTVSGVEDAQVAQRD